MVEPPLWNSLACMSFWRQMASFHSRCILPRPNPEFSPQGLCGTNRNSLHPGLALKSREPKLRAGTHLVVPFMEVTAFVRPQLWETRPQLSPTPTLDTALKPHPHPRLESPLLVVSDAFTCFRVLNAFTIFCYTLSILSAYLQQEGYLVLIQSTILTICHKEHRQCL